MWLVRQNKKSGLLSIPGDHVSRLSRRIYAWTLRMIVVSEAPESREGQLCRLRRARLFFPRGGRGDRRRGVVGIRSGSVYIRSDVVGRS